MKCSFVRKNVHLERLVFRQIPKLTPKLSVQPDSFFIYLMKTSYLPKQQNNICVKKAKMIEIIDFMMISSRCATYKKGKYYDDRYT